MIWRMIWRIVMSTIMSTLLNPIGVYTRCTSLGHSIAIMVIDVFQIESVDVAGEVAKKR